MSIINICSWNVNGLRAILKKDILHTLNKYDIICLQEVKIDYIPDELSSIFPDYDIYLNYSVVKKGYSGTMTLTKIKAKSHMFMNEEGRITEIVYDNFKVVNCYFPQSNKRLEYKMKFCKSIRKLYSNSDMPIIICGDINIAHDSIDIWKEPFTSTGGYTIKEREWYSSMLNSGFTDAYRHHNKDVRKYTWFDYRTRARDSNRGWRIDVFLCKMIKTLSSDIIDIHGSDHLPITLSISV